MRAPRLFPVVLLLAAAVAARAEKPAWKVLYSNDATNLLSCQSPFRPEVLKTFTDAMIRASVDEAAVPGMGAEILQPGTGWVPWWNSKVYPLAEHLAWFKEKYPGAPASYPILDFVLQGNDFVGAFVDECHKKDVAAIVSFRVNDIHFQDMADAPKPGYGAVYAVSKFYADHLDWRLPAPKRHATQKGRGLDWSRQEVRDYKLALIREIAEQYDLDGLELDFMRFPNYFLPEVPEAQRTAIMREFIGKARALLNETERGGKHRWLLARVPGERADWPDVGFDPAVFAQAGIEAFTLANFYTTTQQTEVAAVRAAAPGAAVYLEMNHTSQTWKIADRTEGFDYRRSTKEALESTARLAYKRGADGVALFNIAYYRQYGPLLERRGPFDEPPFAQFAALADPVALEKSLPYFFRAFGSPMEIGRPRDVKMDMAPPAGRPGVLRLQVLAPEEAQQGEEPVTGTAEIDRGQWKVTFNGQVLEPLDTAFPAYPFPTTYKAGFGHPEQYLAWKVPADAAKDGPNTLTIEEVQGPGPRLLRWIEVWFPQE
ncbi:MAG: hypothetical protein PW734_09780 [Verrucomicrobium sp.]|nr:hypothetical protein [Verrucomicrobium sp.]